MEMEEHQREDDRESWDAYCAAGIARAEGLGNRGPMRFDADGRLEQDILDAYRRTGFYVFTGVLEQAEVDELKREFDEILDNAPVSVDAEVDHEGRPVKYLGYYSMSTDDVFRGHGTEPTDAGSAPRAVVGLVSHPLMMMDSALRVYAHPKILATVASVNGEDFVPFHESIFHKGAGEGPPTPWHQDGRTHWTEDGDALEQSDGGGKTHGFNFSVSWSHCTPENCLWVVPGSHRKWRLANDGKFPPITERLPNAVPALLEPGDCVMVNRSSLHGSYPNRSPERRITMVLGYHNRASAIGAETTNVHAFKTPGQKKKIKYSEDYVLKRARMIPLAIDARRQRYPLETPHDYKGAYIGGGEWNEAARAEISRDGDEYWQRDITL
ncbi:MAG: phytanoyl-CoA dioxygenase family protein [Gammaproteobacteria bacterium]|nr:phytanoyl-CoA dioxygenase family protein [Gammaproteobacteria bacterium]